jgi:mono/diheme cytochrome c family protein
MKLSDREASDVAHYLLRETKVPASLEWTEFRGPIRSLGDLDTAVPSRTGPTTQVALNPSGLDGRRPLRIVGWLHIETAGEYTFYLTATGASRLAIDGDWLNGEESWDTATVDEKRKLSLDAGTHQVTVDYVLRGDGPPALKLEWETLNRARGPIPPDRLSSEKEPVTAASGFQVDPVKAAHGRELYARLNCAACHQAPVSEVTSAAALAALDPNRGCLADRPSPLSPDYHLRKVWREALRAELLALKQPELSAPAPQESLAAVLATYHCTACHVRDGKGGPVPPLDAFFTSNGTDLGDEGRLPPRLDGVGNKLRPEWLTNVLTEGVSVRPYLNTRMPVFGAANVGHLAGLLVRLDRHARPVQPVTDNADAQREEGQKLVGTDGLSCIVCHRFNRQPAQTLQIIDLATVTQRLNEDWFREFLLDPERFHPGTRMPAFWPNGVSSLPGVLGGDTVRQHAAIWTYLADGSRAKFPEGLSRQNLELIVGGEAITYRGKLWEAGFRAVAVGYPGSFNLAFDAEEMRLALLWRGRFLDASPHWTVQGMGQIRPLGSEVVVFPHGSPLAVLPDTDAPWPIEPGKMLGLRFQGYQLGALRRPTLFYSFRNVELEDLFVPLENGKAGFSRVLKFKGPMPDGTYFRLGSGKLTSMSERSWRYSESLTISVKGPRKAFLRGKTGNQDLLVPLSATESNQPLEVEYVW